MKITSVQSGRHEQGAVSLFVVVFVTLLMIIITISFIQLMLKDQRQASASDLSQSAYDSAQAGVEDAKRLLLLEQACRSSSPPAGVNCDNVKAAVASNKCDAVSSILGDGGDKETLVQQDPGDKVLQQAYTCVAIANAPDYKGNMKLNESNIIPLNTDGPFDTIEISWFTRDDIPSTNAMTIKFPLGGGSIKLPRAGAQWDERTPSLLRTQFMQTGDSFKLSDFDTSPGNNKSNANTLFLYPATNGVSDMDFALDVRRDPFNAPQLAKCENSFSTSVSYACTTKIKLPAPINGGNDVRGAYLRLSSLYNGTHYKINLLNSGAPQPFDRVQYEVDSTGRANDMFRRVKSRVELKSDFTYPEAAVDIEGDLCKNFVITDDNSGYRVLGACAQ